MEKNAKKEDNPTLKQKTVFVRKIKNLRKEIQAITRVFPKDGNIVANGYVLTRKTIQPSGKITFVPVGKVVAGPPKEEEKKDDRGD